MTFRRECPLVVYFDESISAIAHFYASVTSRSTIRLNSVSDLLAVTSGCVIVTRLRDITKDLLDAVFQVSLAGFSPGIIAAEDFDSLETQAKLKASQLAQPPLGPCVPLWVDFLPSAKTARNELGDRWVIGGSGSHNEMITGLSVGAGVLRIITHSDGIDASFGKRLTLCGVVANSVTDGNKKPPRCVITGHCHRLDLPSELANSKGLLLKPEDIHARVLIWQTCLGFLIDSDFVNSGLAVGRRLAKSPTIGVFITTCDYIVTSFMDTEQLTSAIALGVPVGRAVGEYHREYARIPLHCRLFIFGDPDFSLPEIENAQLPSVEIVSSVPEAQEDCQLPRHSQFYSELTVIEQAVRSCPIDLHNQHIPDLLHECNRLLTLLPDEFDREMDSNGGYIKRCVAHHVLARRCARWIDDWSAQSIQIEREEPSALCKRCLQPADTRRVNLATPGSYPRRMSMCRTCGPIEDVPLKSHCELRIGPAGDCFVSGIVPESNWFAALIVFSDSVEDTFMEQWPADAIGRPLYHFSPNRSWPVGPLRVAFLLVSDSWYLLTCPFRHDN